MWNPDADAPALIDHYIKGAYGPAAPHVRRYLDIILHAKRRQRWVWIGDYVDDTSNFLSDMDAINCMRAMEAARRAVQNDPNKGRRIDVDRLHFQVYHIGAMRYPDLIGPAKAARYNLRPWQFYVDGWKREATSYFNSREFVGNQQLSNENQQLMWWTRYFDMIKDTAETPTAWPKRQNLSHVITPADMTGPARFSVTNDAAGALTRLGDMGIEPYLTASSVVAVLAQRLVRLLCRNCREAYTLQRDELLAAVPDFPIADGESRVTLYRPSGCLRCNNTGYSGRKGVYELLIVSDAIRQLTLQRRSAGEIARQAVSEGMVTLRQDGLQKVKQGITSIEEVLRVIV